MCAALMEMVRRSWRLVKTESSSCCPTLTPGSDPTAFGNCRSQRKADRFYGNGCFHRWSTGRNGGREKQVSSPSVQPTNQSGHPELFLLGPKLGSQQPEKLRVPQVSQVYPALGRFISKESNLRELLALKDNKSKQSSLFPFSSIWQLLLTRKRGVE